MLPEANDEIVTFEKISEALWGPKTEEEKQDKKKKI